MDNPLDEEVTLDGRSDNRRIESILRGSRCSRSARTSSRWSTRRVNSASWRPGSSPRRIPRRGRGAGPSAEAALSRRQVCVPRRFSSSSVGGRVTSRFPNPFGDDESTSPSGSRRTSPRGCSSFSRAGGNTPCPVSGWRSFPFDSAPSEWRDTTRRSWWRRLGRRRGPRRRVAVSHPRARRGQTLWALPSD